MEKGDELIYLYCVTDQAGGLAPGRETSGGPSRLRHEGLCAVVARVPRGEFDDENLSRNLGDLDWVRRRAIAHERVLEDVMSESCLVPFRLATLFHSEENLKTMLTRNAPLLKEALRKLRGHEEWGVKVYCDMRRLRAFLAAGEEEARLDEAIASAAPGKAFLLRKKKEALLDRRQRARVDACGQESYDRLRAFCARARVNRLLPKEATERSEDMILNAAFLVSRGKVRAFTEAIAELRTRPGSGGFVFECTGPWPPYNFCEGFEHGAGHARV